MAYPYDRTDTGMVRDTDPASCLHYANELMTELYPWRSTSEKELYHTRIFSLIEHERTEDVSEKTGTFYTLDASDWVVVIALTADNKFVMVEQFRHGSQRNEIEFVAGDSEHGEDPLTAALRELREETGYIPSKESAIVHLGKSSPNTAFFTNFCHAVLVTNVVPDGSQSFDEHERIRVLLMTEDDLRSKIISGEIRQSLVHTAYLFYLFTQDRNTL